jgi:sulfatase modifying factor 1
MALIDGRFCIDRWEASLVDESGAEHSPYHPLNGAKVRAVSRAGVVPQAYVSQYEARQACERAGKHLCATQEWVDACMGARPPKRTYPYGKDKRGGACNDHYAGGHPVLVLHPGSRRRDATTLNDPRINQLPGSVAKTGAFEACVTPDGVFDMVGNLLEWTNGQTRPLLMGGHYVDSVENGNGCMYVTPDHGEHYHDYTTGFRCCARPREGGPVQTAPVSPETGDAAPPTRPDPVPVASASAGPDQPKAPPFALDPTEARKAPRSFTNPFGYLPHPKPPPYDPPDAPCPVDMVLVAGRRCAENQQVCKGWVDAPGMPQRACGEFELPTRCLGKRAAMRFCIDKLEFTAPGETLPLTYVSWPEAQLLCGAMGKRLCYEREWEFACEGEDGLPYPYGYKREGSRCNHDRDNLFVDGDRLVDQRVAADSLPECKSPFGVLNMVGNVDEWVHRTENQAPRRSILRGGWWLTGRNRCRAATDSHTEAYAGAQTGFRCCKAAR